MYKYLSGITAPVLCLFLNVIIPVGRLTRQREPTVSRRTLPYKRRQSLRSHI